MKNLIQRIQVNIPFSRLQDSYLPVFLRHRLNPEIGFDAASLDRFPVVEVRRVAEVLQAAGLSITVHGPFMDLSPGSPDPAVRTLTRHRLEQLLELVPVLKPKSVVCHAGFDARRYGFMEEAWVEQSVATWSWVAERLGEEKVQLMLENVYEQGPREILPLMERLGGYGVGFCLDTGHQAAFSRTGLLEWAEVMDAYVGQLHLHDNSGTRDDHLALGRGTIDFSAFFDLLKKRGRFPIITLEPHREEDLWPSLEYLEKTGLWRKDAVFLLN